MNKLKILFFILAIVFGILMFVFADIDDSPGGMLLGVIVAFVGVVGAIKK